MASSDDLELGLQFDLVIDIGGVHPLGPLSIEDGFQRGIGNSGDERRRSGNDAGLFRSNRLLPLPFTIGVVATNATITKAQAKRLAMSAHDGLARSIRPAHTTLDGDTLFALATGTEAGPVDLMLLTVMAAEATALATVDAITKALTVNTTSGCIPAKNQFNEEHRPSA